MVSRHLHSSPVSFGGSPVSSQRWPRLTSLVSVSLWMAMLLGRATELGLPCCKLCPTPMWVCLCQRATCSSRNLRNSVNEYTGQPAHLILLFADCKTVFGTSFGCCDSLASGASYLITLRISKVLEGSHFHKGKDNTGKPEHLCSTFSSIDHEYLFDPFNPPSPHSVQGRWSICGRLWWLCWKLSSEVQ